jgi:hypothetical protein
MPVPSRFGRLKGHNCRPLQNLALPGNMTLSAEFLEGLLLIQCSAIRSRADNLSLCCRRVLRLLEEQHATCTAHRSSESSNSVAHAQHWQACAQHPMHSALLACLIPCIVCVIVHIWGAGEQSCGCRGLAVGGEGILVL